MWQWITKEYRLYLLPLATLALVVSYFLWCTGLLSSGIIPTEMYEGVEDIHIEADTLFWLMLFEAAMFEEILFRAPLTFIVRAVKHPAIVAFFIIGLSVVFGYFHQMRWWSVLIQGVFGIMVSVMYLKFGGAQGKFIKPLFCTSVAHFAMNATLFLIGEYARHEHPGIF